MIELLMEFIDKVLFSALNTLEGSILLLGLLYPLLFILVLILFICYGLILVCIRFIVFMKSRINMKKNILKDKYDVLHQNFITKRRLLSTTILLWSSAIFFILFFLSPFMRYQHSSTADESEERNYIFFGEDNTENHQGYFKGYRVDTFPKYHNQNIYWIQGPSDIYEIREDSLKQNVDWNPGYTVRDAEFAYEIQNDSMVSFHKFEFSINGSLPFMRIIFKCFEKVNPFDIIGEFRTYYKHSLFEDDLDSFSKMLHILFWIVFFVAVILFLNHSVSSVWIFVFKNSIYWEKDVEWIEFMILFFRIALGVMLSLLILLGQLFDIEYGFFFLVISIELFFAHHRLNNKLNNSKKSI